MLNMSARPTTTGTAPTFFNLADNVRRSSTGLDPALVAASLRDAVASGALAAADAALGPAAVAPETEARQAAGAHTLDAFGPSARLYTRAMAPWIDARSGETWAEAPGTPFYAPLRCLRIEIPLPLAGRLAAPVPAPQHVNRRRARALRTDGADDHGRDPDSEPEPEDATSTEPAVPPRPASPCGTSHDCESDAFPFGAPPLERLRRNLDAWHDVSSAFDSRRALAELADERSASTRLLSEQLVNLSSRYRFGLDDVCSAPRVAGDASTSPNGNSPGSPLGAALSSYADAGTGNASAPQLGRWVEAACDAYKRFGRLARDLVSTASPTGRAPTACPPVFYISCRYHPTWGSFVAMFFAEDRRRMVAVTADSVVFRRTLTRAGSEVGITIEWLDGAALVGANPPATVSLFAGSATAAGGAHFIVSDATSVVFDFLINLGFASPIDEADEDIDDAMSPLSGGQSPYSPGVGAPGGGGSGGAGNSKVWRAHPQGQGGLDARLAAAAAVGGGAGGAAPDARKAPAPVAPYMSLEATFPFTLGELRQARLRRFVATRHVHFPDSSPQGGVSESFAASPVTDSHASLRSVPGRSVSPAVAVLRHIVFVLEPRAAVATLVGGPADAAAAAAAGAFLLPHVLHSAAALLAARGVKHLSLLPEVAFSPAAAAGAAAGGASGVAAAGIRPSGGGSPTTSVGGMAALAPAAAGGSRRAVNSASPLALQASGTTFNTAAVGAGRQWVGLSRVSCVAWLCQAPARACASGPVEGAPDVTPDGDNPADDCEFAPHVMHIVIGRGPWAPQRACLAVHTLKVFGADEDEGDDVELAAW